MTALSGMFVLLLMIFNSASGQTSTCSPSSSPQVLTGCGGSFTSPNYPANYVNDAQCYWLIQSTAGQNAVVLLEFIDFLTAADDFVRIHDGDNVNAPLVVTLNGSYAVPPGGFLSTQAYMLVEFISSPNISNRGFNATYRSRSFGGACSPSVSPIQLTNGFGTITSPNFPENYASLASCSWLISASTAASPVVKLNIIYFSTRADGDVLSIYDGSTATDILLASLTGSVATPLLIQSTQRYMLVTFNSGYSDNTIGFSATYSTATTGGECSALTRPRYMLTDGGIISSPNFPGSYYGYVECQWVLTAAMPPYGLWHSPSSSIICRDNRRTSVIQQSPQMKEGDDDLYWDVWVPCMHVTDLAIRKAELVKDGDDIPLAPALAVTNKQSATLR